MTTIYLSNNNLTKKKILTILLKRDIACNMYPMDSICTVDSGSKTGKTEIEKGFKIDILDITKKDCISLWKNFKKVFGIGCMYIETDKYEGCIEHY